MRFKEFNIASGSNKGPVLIDLDNVYKVTKETIYPGEDKHEPRAYLHFKTVPDRPADRSLLLEETYEQVKAYLTSLQP